MLRSALDKQWLQRCKEVARWIVDAALRRSILAEFGAQLGKDFRGAGHLAIARLQPLQFSQETASRQRRQSPQEFLDPIRQHQGNVVFRDWYAPSGCSRQSARRLQASKHQNSWREIKN